MSTKIRLSPEELLSQSSVMTGLKDSFESLFSNITKQLQDVNLNWSENLANNFAGKIIGAQNGFAKIIADLTTGAQAAANSAQKLLDIDSCLADLMQSKEPESGKFTIKPNGSYKDELTDAWEGAVDTYRSNNGRSGKTREYVYETKPDSSGYVNILGTDTYYETYYDYTSGSLSYTEGDGFYDFEAGLNRAVRYGKFSDDVGGGGWYSLNGVGLYMDGEYDPAKGNAYVQAGGEYLLASGGLELESDYFDLGVSAGAGAGAHFNAGIHNGVFSVDASVAFGFQLGIKFDLNYQDIWNEACDFGNYCLEFIGLK